MQLIQKRKDLKTKLRNRQKIFACWTSLSHPSITEIFTHTGIDFIGIDLEHSTISQEQAQHIITACQGKKTLCFPRIVSHNMEMIKRLLDSGADGLIIPQVSTSEEVEKLISWSKYPPLGQRGFGIARGQEYGFNFNDYTQTWNEISSLIIQIESIQGVENIEKLLSYDAIDGAMIGPYDLSGSLGIPGKLDHPKLLEASQHVIQACHKYGKACGTQIVDPTQESIHTAFSQGYTLIVLASDIFLLWKWSEQIKNLVIQMKEL